MVSFLVMAVFLVVFYRKNWDKPFAAEVTLEWRHFLVLAVFLVVFKSKNSDKPFAAKVALEWRHFLVLAVFLVWSLRVNIRINLLLQRIPLGWCHFLVIAVFMVVFYSKNCDKPFAAEVTLEWRHFLVLHREQ